MLFGDGRLAVVERWLSNTVTILDRLHFIWYACHNAHRVHLSMIVSDCVYVRTLALMSSMDAKPHAGDEKKV